MFKQKLNFLVIAAILVSCLICQLPVNAEQSVLISSADPTYVGVGARPLGMGKAYVAIAEDSDTIFINPAGISKSKTPKLTSMYSNLLGDVNYIVLGGVYPQTKNSAIGAGAIVSSISQIDLRDSNGTSLGFGSWASSVFFLSYGINIENANLGLGGSLKYFSQGGSGAASVESAASSGIGFDLGAVYSANENLSLGLSLQNPTGAKLVSGNGVENTIPSLIKIGGSYKIKISEDKKMTVAADMDFAKERQSTLHIGAEYPATTNVTFRAGLDQDPVPGGVVNNPTLGVGLNVSGMEFNYAYHPYGNISDNTTHYFSIGYVGDKQKAMEEEASLSIALLDPSDKTVIYSDTLKVSGIAKGAKFVSVNGIDVDVDSAGRFISNVPVPKVGKKLITISAATAAGKKTTVSYRVLRLLTFADISEGHWAKRPIEGSSTLGLVQGYPDGKFRPEKVLTRAELSTLLVRAKGIEVTTRPKQVFKDVKGSHWASAYIKEAVNLGLVKGYPDKKFRPNQKITRSEAIAVLARYDALPLERVVIKPYKDVSLNNWAAKYVQAAKDAGVLSYIEGDKLGLKQNLSRAEAVEMLSKTSVAYKLINNLFSWDTGFEYEKSQPALKASVEQ